MKTGDVNKSSHHHIPWPWNKNWLVLFNFFQGPHKQGKPISWRFSQCSLSEMQASLSAHAVKSAIRVSHPTTEVLCCHFSSLDESSLVPLTSVLNIAWKSISQSLWLWLYHLSLHLLLVLSSLLYPILKLLVRYPNITCHLPFITKFFCFLSS